ncbi:MAG: hypothetical protein ACOCQP_00570 [Lentisphaeria bacterium]
MKPTHIIEKGREVDFVVAQLISLTADIRSAGSENRRSRMPLHRLLYTDSVHAPAAACPGRATDQS